VPAELSPALGDDEGVGAQWLLLALLVALLLLLLLLLLEVVLPLLVKLCALPLPLLCCYHRCI
jgi:hypothetical protein